MRSQSELARDPMDRGRRAFDLQEPSNRGVVKTEHGSIEAPDFPELLVAELRAEANGDQDLREHFRRSHDRLQFYPRLQTVGDPRDS